MQTSAASAGAERRVASDRKLVQCLLCDLLIFLVLVIPVIVCEFGIEPFRRGFFCDDETIRYPFQDNTVTPVMLGVLVGVVPLLIFIIVEFARFYRRTGIRESIWLFGWYTPTWLIQCAEDVFFFCFGLLLTFDATEVGKYTIGRLRPHFMDVCQPLMTDGSSCSDPQNAHRYIEKYVCQSSGYTAEDVRQTRLSFPSGHSSLAFYAMVYTALFLQNKMTWNSSTLFRYFLQFVLILVAWFTALSRVMDNWHHWSDVLIGSIFGIAGAFITARYISRVCGKSTDHHSLKVNIPRQVTSSTLDEVISTPPPYTVNSFSNEQYCTKV